MKGMVMVPYHRFALVLVVVGLLSGCEKQTRTAPERPVDAPTASKAPTSAPVAAAPKPPTEPKPGMPSPHGTQMPPGRPGDTPDPHAGMADPHAPRGGGDAVGPQLMETKLDGITLKVPQGWVSEVPDVNPQMPAMGARAVFRLAPVEGDGESVYVRITHFPGMNVSDDLNLDRWYATFTQPDGTPTKDASTVEQSEVGPVRIVLADIPGTMTVAGASKPGWRMLGAIIKHDQGPHFVKAVGPAKSVEHWKESIVAYLKSVQVN
ncbi:MAG: hypothetical protein V2A79_08240 [Planctomycetota bacterium]